MERTPHPVRGLLWFTAAVIGAVWLAWPHL